MDETHRLFRIHKTVSEMLQSRNYSVPDSDLTMSFDDFKSKFGEDPNRESLNMTVPSRADPKDSIAVMFFTDPNGKTGAAVIKRCFAKMKEDNVKRGILVSNNYTAPAKKGIQDLDLLKEYRLELFQDDELLVNITKHMLVPRHILLSDGEKKELLDHYQLKETQLPRIQLNDPISKFYGLKRGQVVKIIRPSETAGEYTTYRYVI